MSVIGEVVENDTRIDGLGSINALINLFFRISLYFKLCFSTILRKNPGCPFIYSTKERLIFSKNMLSYINLDEKFFF